MNQPAKSLRHKLVTQSVNRQKVDGFRRIIFQLLAKAHDPVVHGSCCRILMESPDVIQQLFSRDCDLRMHQEIMQSLELLHGGPERLSAAVQFQLAKVHHHVSEEKYLRRRLLWLDATSVSNRSHHHPAEVLAGIYCEIAIGRTNIGFRSDLNSNAYGKPEKAAGGK